MVLVDLQPTFLKGLVVEELILASTDLNLAGLWPLFLLFFSLKFERGRFATLVLTGLMISGTGFRFRQGAGVSGMFLVGI